MTRKRILTNKTMVRSAAMLSVAIANYESASRAINERDGTCQPSWNSLNPTEKEYWIDVALDQILS